MANGGPAPVPPIRNIDCRQAFFLQAHARNGDATMTRSITLASVVLFSLGVGVAAAQTNSATPNTTAQGCTPTGDNATVGSAQPGNDLSDKLAHSNGVLCPPSGVDPAMRVPPPQGGALRVVPPPGTPGGDQNTIPK
jgi:hypothetical protein